MPLLPLRPRPLPDEWIGSLIARLAAANFSPMPPLPRKLLNTLGIDTIEKNLTDDDLSLLSAATSFSLTQLQDMNVLPTDLIQYIGRGGEQAIPVPFLGVRYLMACPECLKQDQQPYFRRSWLSQSTFACPTHGGPLHDGCPHCDARIAIPVRKLSSTTLKRRRIPNGVQPRSVLDLRRCWNCHGDLATRTSPLKPPLPNVETLARRFSPGPILDPQVWITFVRALRTYFNAYDLTQLIGPGQVKFSTVPYKIYSRISAEARFHTEQVVVWLLAPVATRAMHPQRRLQLMAGAVLGLLSGALRLNPARRWLHTAWLSTRLLQEPARTLTLEWPAQVTALASLFEGRTVDPRPFADPNFRLHEEPWQMMAPLLVNDLAPLPPRNSSLPFEPRALHRMTMDGILQQLVSASERIPGKYGLSKDRTYASLNYWKDNGQLGIALGQLYRAVRKYRFRLLRPGTWEPAWVAATVAVLMCDQCIELTRTVNPSLHRELFLELIRALEEQNA
jgi:hypothetical protein